MKNTILKCIFTFTLVFGFASANTLTSLSLESNATTVNKGETVQLSLMGTYSDNSTKAVDENITYIITLVEKAEVNGSMLTALKDGNVTVQATVGGVVSNSVNLNITWIVDGHVLPPEPDPKVNNATLLGIDSNNNGVRDDVERWIYEEYKDKHPIYIDIAMQAGRAYKLVLETHTERAKKIMESVEAPLYCELYYRYCADDENINEKRIVNEDDEIDSKYFREVKYFNTTQRMKKYLEYDRQFSGDSYTLIRCSKRKKLCDFNTSQYEDK